MYILWSQVKFSVSPYSESLVFEYVSIYFSNDNCLSDSHLLLITVLSIQYNVIT